MYSDKQKNEALELFMANPFWKEYYDNAPSEECKTEIEGTFCYSSTGSMEEDSHQELLKNRDKMSIKDWLYLRCYCVGNPFYAVCNRYIKKLGGDPKKLKYSPDMDENGNLPEN